MREGRWLGGLHADAMLMQQTNNATKQHKYRNISMEQCQKHGNISMMEQNVPLKHFASLCTFQSTVSLPCELKGMGMICGRLRKHKAGGGKCLLPTNRAL